MTASPPQSIAILGAGITGLTAAHRLAQLGHRVRLFEKQDRTGGVIRSETIDGWLCEHGPNSLLANDPAVFALIEELGIAAECVAANPTARSRYLVRNGCPVAAPLSPPALLTSSLFSAKAKLRLFSEFFHRRRQREHDVSLQQFIEEHFGREIVDYALNPFVAGVYAGAPSELSAQHAFPALWDMERDQGSILRGQIAKAKQSSLSKSTKRGIISFRHGLQTLIDALTSALPAGTLELSANVLAIQNNSKWQVDWQTPQGSTERESFDFILSALPATGLSQLQIGSSGQRPLSSLSKVPHPPVDALVLGYRKDQVSHPLDGFGLLVPEKETSAFLGVIFSSTLFPGRAPEDHHALTVMIGGTRQPELAGLPTEEILNRIRPDLQRLLGVQREPVFVRHHHWPRAIPQYNLGHGQFLDAIANCERQNPGLFIGGQVRDGIALPACIASGEKLAAKVAHS